MKDQELDQAMSDLESKEKEMRSSMAPTSDFSEGQIKSTLRAMTPVLEVLGETEIDPEIFPSYLELITTAVNDAVEAELLDEEMACPMPQTDMDLKYLRGKLALLQKPKTMKAFKRFLEESVQSETEVEPAPEPSELAEPAPQHSNPAVQALLEYPGV